MFEGLLYTSLQCLERPGSNYRFPTLFPITFNWKVLSNGGLRSHVFLLCSCERQTHSPVEGLPAAIAKTRYTPGGARVGFAGISTVIDAAVCSKLHAT